MSVGLPGIGLPHGWSCKKDPTSGKFYFLDHATEHTQWTDPRLTHVEIWTAANLRNLADLKAQVDPTGAPMPDTTARTYMIRSSMDMPATIASLRGAGFKIIERRTSTVRSAPRSPAVTVTPRQIVVGEYSDESEGRGGVTVADPFNVMKVKSRFPNAKEELINDLLLDLNDSVDECIESLKAMGYEDRQAAEEASERRRKEEMEQERSAAREEREQAAAKEKLTSTLSTNHPFMPRSRIEDLISIHGASNKTKIETILYVEDVRSRLNERDNAELTDAAVKKSLKSCKLDVDAVLRMIRKIREEETQEAKQTTPPKQSSPVRVPTASPRKTKSNAPSTGSHVSKYSTEAKGANEAYHCGANLGLHHGPNTSMCQGPMVGKAK